MVPRPRASVLTVSRAAHTGAIVAHRHTRVVAERVPGLAHRGDEPYTGAEVADHVAGMQSLTQLAPVGQVGLGDLLARQHVHRRTVIRIPDDQRPEFVAESRVP